MTAPTAPTTPTAPTAPGDDVLTDERLAELSARGESLLAMDWAEQQAVLAAAGLELQRQLSELSGLTDELGGPEAAEAALAEAWAPIIEDVLALEGIDLRQGFRARPPSGLNVGEGLVGGVIVNGLAIDGAINETNQLAPGQPYSKKPSPDSPIAIEATLAKVEVGTKASNRGNNGAQTDLTTKTVVTTCPAPDGALSAEATVDISVRSGNVGYTGRVVVTVNGDLTDDARIVRAGKTTRMQFADFANGTGKYIDLISNRSASGALETIINRGGGGVDQQFVDSASEMGELMSLLIESLLFRSIEQAIESGRCVQLDGAANPGPKGLQPSATSTITVTSTSKLDGQPTGGTYMATLTDGGARVDPSSSFVAVDAEVTYVAPDETNQSGTVALESRSRRGVGKTTITLDTSAGWKIDQEFQGTRFVGVSCASELGPWTIEYTQSFPEGELSGTFEGTLDPNGTGTFDWTQALEVPGAGRLDIGSSQSPATLVPAGDGFELSIEGGEFGGLVTAAPGQREVSGESGTVTFQVVPAGDQCA